MFFEDYKTYRTIKLRVVPMVQSIPIPKVTAFSVSVVLEDLAAI